MDFKVRKGESLTVKGLKYKKSYGGGQLQFGTKGKLTFCERGTNRFETNSN